MRQGRAAHLDGATGSAPAVAQIPEPPPLHKLLRGVVISLAVAIVVLATVVLPADYNIDPTGVGRWLGLRGLSSKQPGMGGDIPAPLAADPFAAVNPVWRQTTPFRSDELSLTLQPNEGAEIKARMKGGERYVFSWDADGGKVDFDMHGEKANGPADSFTSYWKGRDHQSAGGAFTAPFDGTHGWYWKNRNDKPVTIRVKTSGYYESLYRPTVAPAQAKSQGQ